MGAVDRVLIVGGGIARLTLARALHERGLDVELVERNVTWEVLGAGLSVQPNGMRVLRRLGLDDAVVGSGSEIGCWSFVDQEGGVLCSIYLSSCGAMSAPSSVSLGAAYKRRWLAGSEISRIA